MSKSDLLLYILFIAGFLLFNYIVQKAAKRARQQQEEEERARQEEAAQSAEDEPLEDIWGRKPQPQAYSPPAPAPVEPVRRVEAVPAAPPPAPRRPAPRPLFRSREDLRHAVVVMTVLGPCRALEPHERR